MKSRVGEYLILIGIQGNNNNTWKNIVELNLIKQAYHILIVVVQIPH